MCGCGTCGHRLVVVALALLGEWLDFIILEGFSSLINSVILWLGKWNELLMFWAWWLRRLWLGSTRAKRSQRRAWLVNGPITSLMVTCLLLCPQSPFLCSCLSPWGLLERNVLWEQATNLELVFNANRACLIGLSILSLSTVNEFPDPPEVEQNCIFLIKLSVY